MSERLKFISKVETACFNVEAKPEHGADAYRDVIKLLIAQGVIAPGDKIKACKEAVLSHMGMI